MIFTKDRLQIGQTNAEMSDAYRQAIAQYNYQQYCEHVKKLQAEGHSQAYIAACWSVWEQRQRERIK